MAWERQTSLIWMAKSAGGIDNKWSVITSYIPLRREKLEREEKTDDMWSRRSECGKEEGKDGVREECMGLTSKTSRRIDHHSEHPMKFKYFSAFRALCSIWIHQADQLIFLSKFRPWVHFLLAICNINTHWSPSGEMKLLLLIPLLSISLTSSTLWPAVQKKSVSDINIQIEEILSLYETCIGGE